MAKCKLLPYLSQFTDTGKAICIQSSFLTVNIAAFGFGIVYFLLFRKHFLSCCLRIKKFMMHELSLSQLLILHCFFSGWKHICTMYNDTFLRSFLKNVSYCLLVFVLWKFYAHVTNENWSSAQRKSLRGNKLWLWFFFFFFPMLEYDAHWLHGHKRLSKTIKFCLQIWFCSDTQECYKGA